MCSLRPVDSSSAPTSSRTAARCSSGSYWTGRVRIARDQPLVFPGMNVSSIRALRQHKLVDTAIWLVIAFVAVAGIERYVVKPYRVPTPSMAGTLDVGDRIIAGRILNAFEDPKRGDILVFHPNGHGSSVFESTTSVASINYVKRLIGLPGEWLRARGGKLSVCSGPNGAGCRQLSEPYVSSQQVDFDFHVPAGRYFMLGDNRADSSDSRVWGSIARDQIIGPAIGRYWPLDRVGLP